MCALAEKDRWKQHNLYLAAGYLPKELTVFATPKEGPQLLNAVTTWNPRSLSERQHLALRLAALGLSARAIAKASGYSREHVHKLISTQQGQHARREFSDTLDQLIKTRVTELVPTALAGAANGGQNG